MGQLWAGRLPRFGVAWGSYRMGEKTAPAPNLGGARGVAAGGRTGGGGGELAGGRFPAGRTRRRKTENLGTCDGHPSPRQFFRISEFQVSLDLAFSLWLTEAAMFLSSTIRFDMKHSVGINSPNGRQHWRPEDSWYQPAGYI